VGLRYSLLDYVTFRFDHGWQLLYAPGATTHGDFSHLALTLSY
jgi:hypothetical protein